MNFDSQNYVFNDSSLIAAASNLMDGDNPPFCLEKFYTIYPQFMDLDELPNEVVDMYIMFANEVVKEKRYGKVWEMAIFLFLAHFLTLYLMSTTSEQPEANEVIAAGQTKGLISSKSVGDVSVSYDFSLAVSTVESWGQFNLTTFGTQFANIAKFISKAGMYIR